MFLIIFFGLSELKLFLLVCSLIISSYEGSKEISALRHTKICKNSQFKSNAELFLNIRYFSLYSWLFIWSRAEYGSSWALNVIVIVINITIELLGQTMLEAVAMPATSVARHVKSSVSYVISPASFFHFTLL